MSRPAYRPVYRSFSEGRSLGVGWIILKRNMQKVKRWFNAGVDIGVLGLFSYPLIKGNAGKQFARRRLPAVEDPPLEGRQARAAKTCPPTCLLKC